MNFNIACFTHVGTSRNTNQDRILVQDHIYEEGLYFFPNQSHCLCMVADGIGGNPSGDVAAQFVLEQIIKRWNKTALPSQIDISSMLHSINQELLEVSRHHPQHRGLGTTLVGLAITNGQFALFQAGDSVVWLLRNEIFFKLTEDQVINPDMANSPITSFFGGLEEALDLRFNDNLRDILTGDIFVLASDGLFKAVTPKQVKAILSNSTPLLDRASFILQKALENGAEDNVSCILVEVVE